MNRYVLFFVGLGLASTLLGAEVLSIYAIKGHLYLFEDKLR